MDARYYPQKIMDYEHPMAVTIQDPKNRLLYGNSKDSLILLLSLRNSVKFCSIGHETVASFGRNIL